MSEIVNFIKKELILSLIESVDNGDVDALPLIAAIKEAESNLKYLKDEILQTAIDEFDNFGEKEVVIEGFKFAKTSGATYSYDHCDEWNIKKSELDDIQSKMKVAYSNEQKGISNIDESTGEIITPAIRKPSKESIRVTLPKSSKM